MKPFADIELEALLAELESDRAERKQSFRGDAPATVREAVCAFANDLPGMARRAQCSSARATTARRWQASRSPTGCCDNWPTSRPTATSRRRRR